MKPERKRLSKHRKLVLVFFLELISGEQGKGMPSSLQAKIAHSEMKDSRGLGQEGEGMKIGLFEIL